MTLPVATYRLQFRNGMTFDRAVGLVPYLKKLGISHLYASPLFTATSGSTHGYDVTDCCQIDPVLGGREGFDRLVSALHEAGLQLILDIVPNHMAASLENAWWRDLIEHGRASRYAHYFDIDWSRPLTLPVLGDSFDTVLKRGELHIDADPQSGHPALRYFDQYYPLTPASWKRRKDLLLPTTDPQLIARIHQQQPWRLMSWRDARHTLSYRRFFEITGLVGIRVEDKTVFEATHALILELVHCGAVDGLRIDHIDGLSDPKGYLIQLRQAVGLQCYIIVEKILAAAEHLPVDWPVAGTTGYEFISAIPDALIDANNIEALRQLWNNTLSGPEDMAASLRAAKRQMVEVNFAGEFATLLALAVDYAATEPEMVAPGQLETALRELLLAFPVYRTYANQQGVPAPDRSLLKQVIQTASARIPPADRRALRILSEILIGGPQPEGRETALRFCTRFQQLTGPLMAKSVEDTLFYRQHMALALNEVGADPLITTFSLPRFYAQMQTRVNLQPEGLCATSTHDTKRGEDARARLYTLAEAPERWAMLMNRWREVHRQQVKMLADGPAPEPGIEWMICQALVGVWPPALRADDAQGLAALEARFIPYVEKALREAKLRTHWDDNHEDYEHAVLEYARYLFSPAAHAWRMEFIDLLQPFIRAGLVNSLSQTLLKLTAPGTADIYQGSEVWDFSLVDPDNRREPDFAALILRTDTVSQLTIAAESSWLDGSIKQYVIRTLLHFRQQHQQLFRDGDFLPLTVNGEHSHKVIAFARQHDRSVLIVILPRLIFHDLRDTCDLPGSACWSGTQVMLPEQLAGKRYSSLLHSEEGILSNRIEIASISGPLPFLLLSA
ncbi:(1-_4)-alpha-D-glucan 1-alpha-D-glucosylmutase [Izhakiella capsodis]|uniref:(1->4)-alpha-D-glucan 1-alpha-D-glucosylmutase n=1 Tax=Izhakiella capsodis TaxID=1367852 RepID=A0A1I4UUX1_9GAMM|nr:malto-oligosyltrehalose synthase [Izhakiella capsodis]SFM92794.1 (1->4)-alpha-D-glucan 1-alpha-D-glucosylmutase [Izhakiella capsodis]